MTPTAARLNALLEQRKQAPTLEAKQAIDDDIAVLLRTVFGTQARTPDVKQRQSGWDN
jgi:hypothetical protein